MQAETQLWIYVLTLLLFSCFFFISITDVKADPKRNKTISVLFGLCMLHSFVGLCSEYIDIVRSNYIAQYIWCTLYPVIGYLELFFYGKYFVETSGVNGKNAKRISTFNTAILIINLLGTFITIPLGMFFTVSTDCEYTRGPLFVFSYVFVFTEMIVLDIITLKYLHNSKQAKGYICFCLLPIIVSIAMAFLPIPSVANDVSALISCIILYAFVYVENKNKLLRNNVRLAEYKADIMMSQIGPHFIYNTLSTISALCTIDPEKAQSLTDDFSDYLRANLNLRNTQRLSSFSDELNHAKKYLEIEKIRFGDRINVEYDIETTNFRMPTLSLQPIVENAVKHGITVKDEGGTIIISTKETNDSFLVTISDDGVGFDAENFVAQSGHYGLLTAKERLDILLHGKLTINSKNNEGTTVTIFIDKKEGAII